MPDPQGLSAEGQTSIWGRDFLWPEEIAYENGTSGWLSRLSIPDPEEAITVAAKELGLAREQIQLRPVLMREESEVEAKINSHEGRLWVECTTRAREREPFWRVEVVDPNPLPEREASPTKSSPTQSSEGGK